MLDLCKVVIVPTKPKIWQLLPNDVAAAHQLSRTANISPVVAQLLRHRNVLDAQTANTFLTAQLNALADPKSYPGVLEAAERIYHAATSGKRICIFGDYDVDGTTGTAIMLGVLKLLNAKTQFHIPNRFSEGYGLSQTALTELAEAGVELVVTVDCGITAIEEAELAKRLGIELIITDHHTPLDQLPDATVIVHHARHTGDIPLAEQCGASIALKLAWAIAQRACDSDKVDEVYRAFLMDAVGLAALGLVSDVIPLRDEARCIVRFGLERLAKRPTLGIEALITAAKLNQAKQLKASDIGYKLGPRINAAGRLDCARLVVELLTTQHKPQAYKIAEYLEKLNRDRQTLERRITQQAKELVETNGWENDAALVLAQADWHPGVVGIVASRIADAFGRPTLIIAQREGDVSSGSGRSILNFPLHEAMNQCADLLLTHGGHSAAVGFKVANTNIDALRKRLVTWAGEHFQGEPPAPRLRLDAEVPLLALNHQLMAELNKLEPYGEGNPNPHFLATELKLTDTPRRIGEDRHLSFRVSQGNTSIRAVGWSMGGRLDELVSGGGECSVAFTPKINEFRGQRTVEMEVIDFRPTARPELE